MPILFSAVALEKVILSRFACCEGNFTEIADEVLSKLSPQNGKCTYFHGPYLFNYIADDGHLYFCITDRTCQRSRAFLFLNQIKRRFSTEGRSDLIQMLADEMYRYSEDYSTIVIQNGELDELNSIGVKSSEEVLGEKMLLVEDIDNINYGVISYLSKTPEEVTASSDIDTTTVEQANYSNLETNMKTEPVATYKPEICISSDDICISNDEICISSDEICISSDEIYISNDKNCISRDEICISSDEILKPNDTKPRPNVKIVVAMFLLGLAIYVFDFMPFGHVLVLVLFVIFVLFR